MPAIEISEDHYARLMAFKPLVEEVTQEEMSETEFMDFIAFCAVERLFLESAMSGDLQLIEAIRSGDSVLQGAVETLRVAQITPQGLACRYPEEVFGFIAEVWHGMKSDERRDKGIGFYALLERYRQEGLHEQDCALRWEGYVQGIPQSPRKSATLKVEGASEATPLTLLGDTRR